MFKTTNLPVPLIYVGSVVVMLTFFALAYLRLPPQVPLFYSLPSGTDQVVDTWLIATVPMISLLFIVINTLVVKKLMKKNVFVASINRIANIIIMVISTYVFIKIIVLVAF